MPKFRNNKGVLIKDPLHGYKRKFKRWDSFGKPSKEKDEIIADMRGAISYMRKRSKVRYHPDHFRQKGLITRYKNVVERRDQDIKDLKAKIRSLTFSLEAKDRKIESLKASRRKGIDKGHVRTMKSTIKGLRDKLRDEAKNKRSIQNKLNTLEKRFEALKAKKPTVVYRTKTVKTHEKLPVEANRFKRVQEQALNERDIDLLKVSVITTRFIAREKLSPGILAVLMDLHLFPGGLLRSEMLASNSAIETSLKKGIIGSNRLNRAANYFLTPAGEDLVKRYKHALHYEKI